MSNSCCRIVPVFGLGLLIAGTGMLLYAAGPNDPPPATAQKVTPKAAQPVAAPAKDKVAEGRELFTREWLPKDTRAHGGDGLGPVFNDSSCVACHNQGGVGGAGGKNVDVITAAPVPFFPGVVDGFVVPEPAFDVPQESSLLGRLFRGIFGGGDEPRDLPLIENPQPPHQPTAEEIKKARIESKAQLVKFHPGFASARSIVLHKFGVDAGYDEWRMKTMMGGVEIVEEEANGNIFRKLIDPAFGIPQAVPLPAGAVPPGAHEHFHQIQPDIAPDFAPRGAPGAPPPSSVPPPNALPRATPAMPADAIVQSAPAVTVTRAAAGVTTIQSATVQTVPNTAVPPPAVAGRPAPGVVVTERIAPATPGGVGHVRQFEIAPVPARPTFANDLPLRVDPDAPVASDDVNPVQPPPQIAPGLKLGFGFGAVERIGIDFENPLAAIDPLINLPRVQQLRSESQMTHPERGVVNQIGLFQISISNRNSTALFGVGQIDAIPERVLIDMMKQQREKDPETAGRVAKRKDGTIGRFGWKAQTASLEDFALTACAIELGLNVPGHEQAGLAHKPNYKAPGLDMDQEECNELVAFLKNLPAPSERKAATDQEGSQLKAGEKLFTSVGCAACHAANVGDVKGIYSDLLLHDMGPALGDTGSYGNFTPNSPGEDQEDDSLDQSVQTQPAFNPFTGMPQPAPKLTTEQLDKLVGALRQEWRTPPLWGVRDSAPYLHDGRADTIEQAIAFHGGQATKSAQAFFKLKAEEKLQVQSFLKSLTAPEQVALR